MRYSVAALDSAIDTLLPNLSHVSLPKVDKINMIAKQVFMYPDNYIPYELAVAAAIVKSALIDLTTDGQFNYL